jgi:hypothetical protein
MRWRERTLAEEAARNVSGSAVRTVVVAMVAALLAGGLSWVEYATTDSLLAFQKSYLDQGGHVVVAFNLDGLNAARCERLQHDPGVLGSGAVREGSSVTVDLAPGTLFNTAEVTAGIFAVWTPNQAVVLADLSKGPIVGRAAADELGVEAGRFLAVGDDPPAPIPFVADTEQRSPYSMRWLLTVVPPSEPMPACWVEFTPGTYEAGQAKLTALFADSGPALSVRPYRTLDEFAFDPRQALAERPQREGWLPLGLTLAALVWIMTWFRRSEVGLYRAVGTTTPQLAAMVWLEAVMTVGLGMAAGWVWATALREALGAQPLVADQMLVAARNTGSALLLALALSPLATLALGRGSIAHQLKDR